MGNCGQLLDGRLKSCTTLVNMVFIASARNAPVIPIQSSVCRGETEETTRELFTRGWCVESCNPPPPRRVAINCTFTALSQATVDQLTWVLLETHDTLEEGKRRGGMGKSVYCTLCNIAERKGIKENVSTSVSLWKESD